MLNKVIKVLTALAIIVGIIFLFDQLSSSTKETIQAVFSSPLFVTAVKYVLVGGLIIVGLVLIAIVIIAVFAISKVFGSKSGNGWGNYGFLGKKGFSWKWNKMKHSQSVEISCDDYDSDSFKIRLNTGDVSVSGHDEKSAKAIIKVGQSEAGPVLAKFENGEIKIETKNGEKCIIKDAKIILPKKLNSLDIKNANGDIEVSDFEISGLAQLKTVNGDIDMSNFNNTENLTAKTVNGDILLKESQINNVSTASVNGDIILKESVIENLDSKTMRGDIDYKTSKVTNPNIKTVSGDVS
ncbi:MAG: DUF4097 family beta strand repeat protein [Elusimicrobiales bacterium]|nr:DUF4097 family beta strand repeat protein [Elusimicrobiales bacterium]